MKSALVPDFANKYSGILKSATAILDYLYLHPSHAPWEMGPGIVFTAIHVTTIQFNSILRSQLTCIKVSVRLPLESLQTLMQTDTISHMALEVELSRMGQHQGKSIVFSVYV